MSKRHTRRLWLALVIILIIILSSLRKNVQDEQNDEEKLQQAIAERYSGEETLRAPSKSPWMDEKVKSKLEYTERLCTSRQSRLYFGAEKTSLQDTCQYYLKNQQLLPNEAYLHWSLTPGSIYLRQVDYYRCRRRVLFVVHSSPSEDTLRSVWRETLAQYQKSSRMPQHMCVALVFAVGSPASKSLLEEASSHSDILQGDFVDSYTNLTHKALSWLHFFCRHKDAIQPRELRNMQSLIVKIDSDTIVNFNMFFSLLDAYFDAQELEDARAPNKIACYIWEHPKVDKSANSAWHVRGRVVYANSQWPPYCAGFLYALPPDTVRAFSPFVLKENILFCRPARSPSGRLCCHSSPLTMFTSPALCAFSHECLSTTGTSTFQWRSPHDIMSTVRSTQQRRSYYITAPNHKNNCCSMGKETLLCVVKRKSFSSTIVAAHLPSLSIEQRRQFYSRLLNNTSAT